MENTTEQALDIISIRPHSLDYINLIFSDFIEMHGDRFFGDDESVVTGIAMLNKIPVTIIGQMRGKTIRDDAIYHHSMNYPEGYRKALRAMKQAEKFNRPIITFVDTVGAFPGDSAEDRGQNVAIANNLMEMMYLKVPIISIFIGSGGSGGALAISVADEMIMLENSTFGVIAPKACANILWKDSSREKEAAALLKNTAHDLMEYGIIDNTIKEPKDMNENPKPVAQNIKKLILEKLDKYKNMPVSEMLNRRYEKFRKF